MYWWCTANVDGREGAVNITGTSGAVTGMHADTDVETDADADAVVSGKTS